MKNRLFFILFTVLLLVLIPFSALQVQAASTDAPQYELKYQLNADGTGYIVTGYENEVYEYIDLAIPDSYNGKPVTEIGQRAFGGSRIASLVIPGSVTHVGTEAFWHCDYLTNVTVERGTTHIGARAFYYCGNLETITLPDTLSSVNESAFGKAPIRTLIISEGSEEVPLHFADAFKNTLKNVVIPDSVKIINDYAFYDFQNLTSVTIGKGVTHIFSYAFYGCSKLTEVHISDLAAWCKISFSQGFSIPTPTANPLCNGGKLYLNGKLVTDLVIPNSVTSVKGAAFSGCSSLTSVTIPDHVTSLGAYTFSGCSSLTNLIIPNSVTSIGECTFADCTGLTSITIPDSVTSITNSADSTHLNSFRNCSIDRLIIADGSKTITYKIIVGNPKSVLIPGSITSIGRGAFSDCDRLEDVYITDPSAWCKINFETSTSNPMENAYRLHILGADGKELTEFALDDSVTEIPDKRFQKCRKPIKVTIGDNVTRIGESAFEDCSNLMEIVFPKGLDVIEYDAFWMCEKIETIYFKGTEAEWNLVIIDNGNYMLKYANIIFNYTGTLPPVECDHRYNRWWHFDDYQHFQICYLCGEYSTPAAHIPDGEPTEQTPQTCIVCGYMMQAPLSHVHDYADTWSSDETGHWYACSGCEIRGSYDTHISGPDSTAEGDDICIVCNYVMEHQHYYQEEWSMDETGHWLSCYWCEERENFTPHSPGPAATDTTAQTCTVCGYVIEAAPGHIHSYSTSWESDHIGHWHSCSGCEARSHYTRHTPGPAATATSPQICTVCGRVLVPARGETTPPAEPPTEPETQPGPEIADPNTPEENSFPWLIVVMTAAVAAAVSGATVFMVIKKRKS